jgi:hypothetical protein
VQPENPIKKQYDVRVLDSCRPAGKISSISSVSEKRMRPSTHSERLMAEPDHPETSRWRSNDEQAARHFVAGDGKTGGIRLVETVGG